MPARAESKAERESREDNERKYLAALYEEHARLHPVAAGDTPGAVKAKRRVGEIVTEIKRCGGQAPTGRRGGPNPVGFGNDTPD